jgi:plasmid stabilization system protein ParE
MRIVYLASAVRDLQWLRHYYQRVFPAGAARAAQRIRATERLVLDNPHAGRPTQRREVRRVSVARTPFFLLYRLSEDRIEILRVIDSRSFDSLLGE